MKFQNRAKFRFFDCSDSEFDSDCIDYYENLRSINFQGRENVLQYFGDSFFHDAKILNLQKTPIEAKLKMILTSWNILEDVRDFRKRHGLKRIKDPYFERNKPLYLITFNNVTSCDFTKIHSNTHLSIMDTELSPEGNQITLNTNFSETEEISITFETISFEIYSKERLLKLTNGLSSEIPYCEFCLSNMLTVEKVMDYKKLNNTITSLVGDDQLA